MLIEVYNSVGEAAFFRRLLQEWQDNGAQVILRQAISESDYRAVRRWPAALALRWRMYAGYAWTCWRAAGKMSDVPAIRVVTTNPFFAPALVKRTAPRGVTVNLVYDLFPEALIQAGKIKSGSLLALRCAAVTRFALQECDVTVFLGDRLRGYAESAYGPARRAVVIPVGADGRPFANSAPLRLPDGEQPKLLYSGVLGHMHDFRTLAAGLKHPAARALSWAFHASGAGYVNLRREVGSLPGVSWGTSLPDSDWQRVMKQAQVAVVTIARGAERVVMPSKTYSALVAGQAILAICPRVSDLADLIIRHDCGWVVEPGDDAGLSRTLADIADNPDELLAKRTRAFAAGHEHYDMSSVAARWLQLFAELNNQPASAADVVCASVR